MNTQTLLKSARGALVATAFAAAGFIAIPANGETYYLKESGSITAADVWTNSTGTATTLLDDANAVDHADDWFIIDDPYYVRVVNTNGTDNGNSQDHYFNAHIGFQGWARLFFYGQSLDGCTLHLNGNSHLVFCGPNSNPSEMPSIKSNASIIVEGGTRGVPARIRGWHENKWVDNRGLELKCPISGSGYLCLTYFEVNKMIPIVLNPETEGGNSNFTGALHIMGATNSLGEAQLQEVRVMTPDALGGDLKDFDASGLDLDYAKLVVSANVTTTANRALAVHNESEISVDEGNTLTVLGRHWFANKLTKTGKGTLYLRGGTVAGGGEFTVEEGTLMVGHSENTFDLFSVNVNSNATIVIAESGAKMQGHIDLHGGTLVIPDNVSVVSNGTSHAAEKGIYVKPFGTASLVIGENVNLDIRGVETTEEGCMLNITAPESAHVRILRDVYLPEFTEITPGGLSHITYNGSLATIGSDYTLTSVDTNVYFNIGDKIDLKDCSLTVTPKQAAWLNCCIDNGSVHTKDGIKAVAKDVTREEFDKALMLTVDIANRGTYGFGVTKFEILRNYEDEVNKIELGDYAKIYVRLERTNPVANFTFSHIQMYASSTLEGVESSPTDVSAGLDKADDDETETARGDWKVKEAHVYHPLAVEEGDEPLAFFKAKLEPSKVEE